jgi:hypothetical protein
LIALVVGLFSEVVIGLDGIVHFVSQTIQKCMLEWMFDLDLGAEQVD